MNRIVLDSSALLAILHEEPGVEIFTRQFDLLENAATVSYTHLDVYKRQAFDDPAKTCKADLVIALEKKTQ